MQTETLHAPIQNRRWDLSDMPPGRRRAVIAALAVSCLLFLAGFATTVSLWRVARRFPEAPFRQPSRLYAAAVRLTPGAPASGDDLVDQLTAAGYRQAAGDPGRARDPEPVRGEEGDRCDGFAGAQMVRAPRAGGTGELVDLSFLDPHPERLGRDEPLRREMEASR